MQDITDLDQLDNYFTQVSLEEQTIQLALQDILFKDMRQVPFIISGQDMSKELSISVSSFEKVLSKTKKMDQVSCRVNDCLTLVGDLVDLKSCTSGIQSCLDNEEYENAALIVQRFLKIDQQEVKKVSKTSMEEAFSKLQSSTVQLQEMVLNKFDEAVSEDDVASVERFFKLFPFLGQEEEGLAKYTAYLSSKIPANNQNISHTEQLGSLLQSMAKMIDVHQPLVETYYKHGHLLSVVQVLQKECDVRAEAIIRDFKHKSNLNKMVRVVSRTLDQSAVSAAATSNTVSKVDPIELDTLLTEVILMNKRCETYLDFVKKRVTEDLEAADIKSVDQVQYFLRSCQLSNSMQDLSGHYVLLEKYFIRESVTKAIIEFDNLLDDVFFILKKCLHRSCASGNMDVLCAVVNECITVLETDYLIALHDKIRFGFPNSISIASLDLTQAYNALQSGRYLQSNQTIEQTKKTFLAGVNHLDLSCRAITSLSKIVKEEVLKSSVLQSSMPKLDSCLLDLNALTYKFRSMAKKGLHDIFLSLLKPRVKMWVNDLSLEDHEVDESDLGRLEMRDLSSSLIRDLDTLLKNILKPSLTDDNFNSLVVITTTDTVVRMENAITKCLFNKFGAIQLEREVRTIISYLTSLTSISMRDKFCRLRDILSILSLDSVSEAADLNPSSITMNEVKTFLKLRTDFNKSDIRRLKL